MKFLTNLAIFLGLCLLYVDITFLNYNLHWWHQIILTTWFLAVLKMFYEPKLDLWLMRQDNKKYTKNMKTWSKTTTRTFDEEGNATVKTEINIQKQ